MFARWTDGNYYRGFVVSPPEPTYSLNIGFIPGINHNLVVKMVSILYDDEDTIKLPIHDSAAVILDALPPKTDFAPTKRVIAFWPDRKEYFPGEIKYKVFYNWRTLYHVKFDDGGERDEEFYQMRIIPA